LAEPIVRGEFVGKRLRGLIAILVGLAFYSMMKGNDGGRYQRLSIHRMPANNVCLGRCIAGPSMHE
ncbi:hypothetical protein N8612_03900, partial [Verrucomicrobia bacterium]|nr:hypothetical protein [Verrucomicrobiota bacterium]